MVLEIFNGIINIKNKCGEKIKKSKENCYIQISLLRDRKKV